MAQVLDGVAEKSFAYVLDAVEWGKVLRARRESNMSRTMWNMPGCFGEQLLSGGDFCDAPRGPGIGVDADQQR